MSEKKKHEPEYTLHVFHGKDPETSDAVVVFAIQTVREFVSFRYEIPLESTIAGTTIDLKIRGLRVPENLVSGKGEARGIVYHRKLKGDYDLIVTNVDGVVNRFSVKVTPNAVVVQKLSRKPFIVYSPEPIRV